MSQIRVIPIK